MLAVCLAGAMALQTGCASLDKGADPLVVRVEQAQQGARSTFDLVLAVDHANREFWRTNAPAFHRFCDWLRAPQVYDSPEYGQTNIARALLLQFQLDDVKREYLAARASSNALWTAWATLRSALDQAAAWEQVILSTPKE